MDERNGILKIDMALLGFLLLSDEFIRWAQPSFQMDHLGRVLNATNCCGDNEPPLWTSYVSTSPVTTTFRPKRAKNSFLTVNIRRPSMKTTISCKG